MAILKCKNFGSCSLADSNKEFSVPAGADDRCPECGMSLVTGSDESEGSSQSARKRPVLAAGALAALAVIVLAGGYGFWASRQVAVLKPDGKGAAPSLEAKRADGAASAGGATAASSASSPAAVGAGSAPGEAVAAETKARVTCDEATRAKVLDAERICRRAAAVTLLNSGAQAAVGGKLDQAERDYSAAREKDSDIPELYYNIALLKARQGKNSEAVDNLLLASSKGFKQFDLLKGEPAFEKLRGDPAYKAKLDGILK